MVGMVEFITLLLGLVTGIQAVEVSAGPEVARVEFLLDGHSAGAVDRAPWFVNCDFGTDLAPHELVAVAYDGENRQLETVRQWVNMPRQRAEARLILDRGTLPVTVRLIWAALDTPQPPAALVTFDGERLDADDLEAIALPPHDPQALHFLRADLLFPGAERANAELVFGGEDGEELWTELTAVPMIAGKRPPKAAEMDGWFLRHGRPLRAVAVESGPINLVVVRERSSITRGGLELVRQRYLYERSNSRQPPVDVRVLDYDDQVRFVFPTTGRDRMRVGQGLAQPGIEQVPVSRPLRVKRTRDRRPPLEGEEVTTFDSLFEILTNAFYPGFDDPAPVQELADAVAIAGLTAAAGDQRRAVVLVVSGDSADSSRLTAAEVRDYLDKLRIPLFVWSITVPETADGEDEKPAADVAATLARWGPIRDVSSRKGFNKALDELRKALRPQILVWLEGAHLAHQVELTDRAAGLRPVVDDAAGEPAGEALVMTTAPEAPPADRESATRELETVELGPYSLDTEVNDRKLTAMLARVAEEHQRLYAERYGLDPLMRVTGRVVLLADERELLEFKRLQGHDRVEVEARGYFQPPSLVVLQRGGQTRQEVASLLLHELTHLLSWRSLAAGVSGRELPPWLEEGLAGDLALSSLGRQGLAAEPLGPANLAYGRSLGVVLFDIGHKIATDEAPSLPKLMEMDRATFLAGGGQVEYLLSALWVRFLLSGDRAEGFRTFLTTVARGHDAGAAELLESLGEDWPRLESSFRGWLSQQRRRVPVD